MTTRERVARWLYTYSTLRRVGNSETWDGLGTHWHDLYLAEADQLIATIYATEDSE